MSEPISVETKYLDSNSNQPSSVTSKGTLVLIKKNLYVGVMKDTITTKIKADEEKGIDEEIITKTVKYFSIGKFKQGELKLLKIPKGSKIREQFISFKYNNYSHVGIIHKGNVSQYYMGHFKHLSNGKETDSNTKYLVNLFFNGVSKQIIKNSRTKIKTIEAILM